MLPKRARDSEPPNPAHMMRQHLREMSGLISSAHDSINAIGVRGEADNDTLRRLSRRLDDVRREFDAWESDLYEFASRPPTTTKEDQS